MRASKLTACVCALALLCAAPNQAVAAAADLNSPATSLDDTPKSSAQADAAPGPRAADDPAEAGEDAPQQAKPRKKGNAFVRVITAPFRGLAKLFGGGDKRPKVARVKVEVTPKPTPAPADAPAQTAAKPAPAAQDTQPAAQTVTPMTAPRQASLAPPPPTPAPTPVPGPAPLVPRSVIADDTAAKQQQQQAAEPFMPLIVGVPRDPLSQGRALLAQGYLNEAIAELSIAAVNSTNLVEANNLLGLAYDRRGWHQQAREYYERALSVAPNDPQVLNNLGYSLYLDDRYNDALGKLKQAARRAPESAPVQNNLALVYGRLRKYDEAFKHFARAGGELYARLQTGALLDFAGRDRDAIKHFEAARRLDPSSTEALRRLITLYNRTGQRDKAEAAQQELDRPKTKAVS